MKPMSERKNEGKPHCKRKTRYRAVNPMISSIVAIVLFAVFFVIRNQASKRYDPGANPPSLGENTVPSVYTPSAADEPTVSTAPSSAYDIVSAFARDHNLQMRAWPKELIELLEKNPDTKDFVLNYPLKKNETPAIDLSEFADCRTVPLLFQWDERWGYHEYAGEMMGTSGCGPTCLSMVCIYLLKNTDYNPKYIAEFSTSNGYSVPGDGSSWTLISQGGKELGLDVTEIPLDEDRILRNLEAGNPIICVMGPGDFTTTGHYIVMTGYIDGKIKVNDPNSKERSEKLWNYEDIQNQIRNLWVCR